jgi:hypothetical protein
MRASDAYPVSLVGNFDAAVRQHSRRSDSAQLPAPTDMMILRALLAHPLVEQTREAAERQSGLLAGARAH